MDENVPAFPPCSVVNEGGCVRLVSSKETHSSSDLRSMNAARPQQAALNYPSYMCANMRQYRKGRYPYGRSDHN
ncbi:MAG: hypothetical protein JWQ49_5271 [Edaphobacter sp.]|nr:hypothetical protein [Edaphobacter sp.]